MTAGVYIIRNKANGKVYVGSATHVEKRLKRHRSDLLRGKHPNQYLQRAFNKEGSEQFCFEVLMLCDVSERLQLEQSYIDSFRSTLEEFGYNLIPTRESQLYGKEISNYQRAGWAKFSSEERKQKASHLNETREKALKMATAARNTPEHRKFRKDNAVNGIASPETRKKNSDRLKLMWQNPEFRKARLAGLTIGRNKTNAKRKNVL